MNRPKHKERPIRGYLEPIGGMNLRGWVHGSRKSEHVVELLVDGRKVAQAPANLPRPDLARTGIHARCGFQIPLDGLPENRVSRVSARVVGTSFDFNGQERPVCPAVLRRADEIREVFHADCYQSRYGLSFASDEQALKHFLTNGIHEGFDPSPWFDGAYFRGRHADLMAGTDIPLLAYLDNQSTPEVVPSEHFEPAFYLKRYPDLAGCAGPMKHFVGHGHAEGRYPVELRVPRAVLQELEALRGLEPSLPSPESLERQQIVRYPFLKPESFVPGAMKRRYGDDIQAIICVPHLVIGGADLYASLMLQAFQERFGVKRVLLIVTDQAAVQAPNLIDDSTRVHFLAKAGETLSLEQRIRRLHDAIGALAPKKVHNMNSHAAWEVYRRFGRQLASVTDLYANMFCLDSPPGEPARGYIPDYARNTIGWLAKVFTDNRAIIDYIEEQYRFSEENQAKFVTLYAPCLHDFPDRITAAAPPGGRPKVLWCGRLAKQKRPDRLLSLASLLPAMDFHVYGPPGDSEACGEVMKPKLSNVHYHGTYDSLDELDLSSYSMFLNTSDWDGLANILIQVAKAGVPIVSSQAGGIKELVNDETGWLVENNDDMDAYLTCMRRIVIDRSGAYRRARRATKLVAEQHDWKRFVETLDASGVFDLDSEPVARAAEPLERRRNRSDRKARLAAEVTPIATPAVASTGR